MAKIKLEDVKKAEAEYALNLIRYGEHNQATIRAEIRYSELKKKYQSLSADDDLLRNIWMMGG